MIESRWIAGVAALTAVLLLASSGRAVDLDALKSTTPKERAGAQTTMMKAKLGLSDEQTPKVAAINQKYAEKMEPVIKGSQGPLMKARAAKEIEAGKEAELKKVLTGEQFEKFLAGKEEMREKLVDHVMAERAHRTK